MSRIEIQVEDAGSYDVIVVGGGLSGVCAAVASARNGARTLLAEALPYVGGNGVIGLPISSYRAANYGRPIVGGIPLELLEGLRKRGAVGESYGGEDWQPVDCEALQIELTHLLDEAGVELLTHSPLLAAEREGRKLRAATFYSKDRPLRYEAAAFIDASGDANLAGSAGLPTPMGRERDGKTQPMTMMFTLGGVDLARVPDLGAVKEVWERLRVERGGWLNPRSAICEPNPIPGKPGVISLNVTRIIVEKGTDSRVLTMAEKEGRYQVEEFVEQFLRPHIPGYEKCFITQIGCRVGVRETRRIVGLYELQKEDLIGQRRFEDAVACNSYPVDIHSPDGGTSHFELGDFPDGAYYTLPYRCLVAKDADNLWAAGRCLSASHEALSAVRVLSAAMATGEAAGTAAALCAREGCAAGDLDMGHLRSTLRAQGAIVE